MSMAPSNLLLTCSTFTKSVAVLVEVSKMVATTLFFTEIGTIANAEYHGDGLLS